MKKLLATVCAAALLLFAAPVEAPAMPFMHGALKGNTVIGAAASVYQGAFSTVATQSSFSWNTVDLGVATADRKVGVFVTCRSAAGTAGVGSVTVAGVAAHYITERRNILNNITFYIAEVPSDTSNQTITVNFITENPTQCSIMIFSLYSVGIIAPIDLQNGITDNVAINSYVHAKGLVLCGLMAQSAAGTTTWTNATEAVDAVYTGNSVHSAAHFSSASEVATQAITADVTGTVTDLVRLNISLVPYSSIPFVYQWTPNQNNTANLSTYTFSNVYIGPPSPSRKILVYSYATVNSPYYLTDITIDGVSGTQLHGESGSSGNVSQRVAIRGVPNSGLIDIVVTASNTISDCGIVVFILYGVTSETPHDSGADYVVSNTVNTVAIDVPDNGLIVSGCLLGASSDFALTYGNITERLEAVSSNINYGYANDNNLNSQSGRSITATWTSATHKKMWAGSFF